jgi:hypothetical protein
MAAQLAGSRAGFSDGEEKTDFAARQLPLGD